MFNDLLGEKTENENKLSDLVDEKFKNARPKNKPLTSEEIQKLIVEIFKDKE
jgi:hypothetical protein